MGDFTEDNTLCPSHQSALRTRCTKIMALLYLATVTTLLALTAALIIFETTDTPKLGGGKPAAEGVIMSLDRILPNLHECGHPSTDEQAFRRPKTRRSKRVIGGEVVRDSSLYPWLVKLLYEDKHGELKVGCTGTLITRRHILTVAHCVNCTQPTYIEMNGDKTAYKVAWTWTHPGYTRQCNPDKLPEEDSNRAHDIAVALLEDEVPSAKPICLPLPRFYHLNTTGILWKQAALVGWGPTTFNESTDATGKDEVHHALIHAVDSADCKSIYEASGDLQNEITNDMFCAGDENGNFCNGDSGAPYFLSMRNRSFIAGLASFGHKGCDPDVPSVFVKVTSHLNWILKILRLDPSTEVNTVE